MAWTPGGGPESLSRTLEVGGTVRVGAADVAAAAVEEWASGHQRTLVTVDTMDCASGAELIDALSAAFAFPEEAVSDWDSLDEELGDYDVAPAEGLVVVWSNWDSIAMDDEPAIAVAVDALRTAAQSWCDDGVPWAVLVVGDGPAWNLPWAGEMPAPWEHRDTDDDEPDDEAGSEVGLESLSRW